MYLATDEPEYGVNPEGAQDNLHEGFIPRMAGVDVMQFVAQHTASFFGIGRYVSSPEDVAKEREWRRFRVGDVKHCLGQLLLDGMSFDGGDGEYRSYHCNEYEDAPERINCGYPREIKSGDRAGSLATEISFPRKMFSERDSVYTIPSEAVSKGIRRNGTASENTTDERR